MMNLMVVSNLVGRNLSRIRVASNFTLGELARRSRVSKQTIAKIELGEGNPTIETLALLADALKVGVRDLVADTPDDLLLSSSADAEWQRVGTVAVRRLDRVRGTGYVTSNLLRLTASSGVSHHESQGRGSLRHVYVVDGAVIVGVGDRSLELSAGDFLRFPADHAHTFRGVYEESTIHVVTTSPQSTVEPVEIPF